MSDLEKINIYVPKYIGSILENDATMFEVYKRDGHTINKNRFLSMLILGYHNSYSEECRSAYDSIMKELSIGGITQDQRHEIAKAILENVVLPQIPSRKGKNPTRLSLKPTNATEAIITNIDKSLDAEDTTPQYLCRLIMCYCEKPLAERERIIFHDHYERLQDACEKGRTVSFSTIWNPSVIHEVLPYKLAVGKEEMYNYLLCVEKDSYTGRLSAKAYRLNRIDKLSFSHSILQMTDDVEQHLKKMLKYGPQFMINDDDVTCVKLTELGRKAYNRIYYGRPSFDSVEQIEDEEYYYFKCSTDQIFMYFRRFGRNEVEIISPEWLRRKMIDFHEGALEVYRRDLNGQQCTI